MRATRVTCLLLTALGLASCATAGRGALPPDVEGFIRDREVCEHFRGEPYEGDSPEQIERRKFVLDSLEIHCAGTDRRLSALKRRYGASADVMERLNKYEERIEGTTADP